MIDIIVDTIIDVLKLIPFLFVAFLLIEVLEHKLTNKNQKYYNKIKKTWSRNRSPSWHHTTMWFLSNGNKSIHNKNNIIRYSLFNIFIYK